MFNSFKDALVYPFRGHNFWKFLVFILVVYILSFLAASITNSATVGNLIVPFLTAAYFWGCMSNLAQRNKDLPGSDDNPGYGVWQPGMAIQFLILVFGVPIVLFFRFLGISYTNSLILFAVVFYLYLAIAVVRYVAEEKAIVMYDAAKNIRIIGRNWRTCLSLLGTIAIVIAIAYIFLVIVAGTTVVVLALFPSPQSIGFVLTGWIFRFFIYGIVFYVCFVNTYLFYRFGVSIGYFEASDSKVKIVEPIKPYRSISERLGQL